MSSRDFYNQEDPAGSLFSLIFLGPEGNRCKIRKEIKFGFSCHSVAKSCPAL